MSIWIVADGHSGALISPRVAELYSAAVKGRDPAPEAYGSLRTLLENERRYQRSDACAADQAHWAGRSAEQLSATRLAGTPSGTPDRNLTETGRRTRQRPPAPYRGAAGAHTLVGAVDRRHRRLPAQDDRGAARGPHPAGDGPALLFGKTLVIPDDDVRRDPDRLVEWLDEQQINEFSHPTW